MSNFSAMLSERMCTKGYQKAMFHMDLFHMVWQSIECSVSYHWLAFYCTWSDFVVPVSTLRNCVKCSLCCLVPHA